MILDKGQWITLTLGCHKSSCTHLFDYMYTYMYIHLKGFNLQLKHLNKRDQIWPCCKICQPRVIIWTNLMWSSNQCCIPSSHRPFASWSPLSNSLWISWVDCHFIIKLFSGNFLDCTGWLVGWLCWGLTSQSTIFQSCRDGAIASWVINQYFRGVKCLAQGHNTAAVGFEPRTSRSGVRHDCTGKVRRELWNELINALKKSVSDKDFST